MKIHYTIVTFCLPLEDGAYNLLAFDMDENFKKPWNKLKKN
jgi:hypothetical protein